MQIVCNCNGKRVANSAARLLGISAAMLAPAMRLAAAELIVPTDHSTIQEAVDQAEPGDTVTVEPGSYSENLVLKDDLVVRGRETARVLLSPADEAEPAVLIANATSVLLSNITLIDAEIAIAVQNSADVTVSNSVLAGARDAALATDVTSDVDAEHNVFFENAIAVRRGSTDTELSNNILAGNAVTVTGLGLIDRDIAVRSSCLSDNADLSEGGGDAGLGTSFQIGDPRFVDSQARDFHLREDSPCIDAGSGTDGIDGTVADIGAYGGGLADPRPFPVARPTLENLSGAEGPFRLQATWPPNLAYLVTNSVNSGGYRLYYRANRPGPPYDGTDAANGTLPSPIDVGTATTFVLEDLSGAVETPDAPRLLAAEPRSDAVVLRWSEVPNATSYRVIFGVESANERAVEAGSATTHTVTGLDNGVAYRFAVIALAQARYFVAATAIDNTQARHESALSEPGSIAVGPVQMSAASNELTATPQVTVPVPDLPDEGCFIATAAYGADWAAEVQILRDFRDRYLHGSWLGRATVAAYYAASPRAAAALERHPRFKPWARAALGPAVAFALLMVASGPGEKLVVLALVLALSLGVCRMRRLGFATRMPP
jgi:hypothetical protein